MLLRRREACRSELRGETGSTNVHIASGLSDRVEKVEMTSKGAGELFLIRIVIADSLPSSPMRLCVAPRGAASHSSAAPARRRLFLTQNHVFGFLAASAPIDAVVEVDETLVRHR